MMGRGEGATARGGSGVKSTSLSGDEPDVSSSSSATKSIGMAIRPVRCLAPVALRHPVRVLHPLAAQVMV
jgi:hypothetical protein